LLLNMLRKMSFTSFSMMVSLFRDSESCCACTDVQGQLVSTNADNNAIVNLILFLYGKSCLVTSRPCLIMLSSLEEIQTERNEKNARRYDQFIDRVRLIIYFPAGQARQEYNDQRGQDGFPYYYLQLHEVLHPEPFRQVDGEASVRILEE